MIADAVEGLLARFDLAFDLLAGGSGLRGQTIIKCCQNSSHNKPHDHQRDKNPVKTHAGTEHGDDLVAP